MKFSVSREALLKPLQMVVGVVERRQTLPILANVLVSLDGDTLSLTGTDLEVEMVGHIQLPQAGDSGEITIPARKLLDISRSLPEGAQIQFAENDGRVVVSSGRSRFTLSTLPAIEFPSVDDGPNTMEFTIPQAELKSLIDATAFAMAQQDVRYYLNGMLWEVMAGQLRTVATDGHRLAMSTREVPTLHVDGKIQSILPRKAVIELSRLLAAEGDVKVMLGNNHMRVVTQDLRFTSKLVDGAYPDYDRVLPRGGDKVVVANRGGFLQACARAAILSNEKYRGVRLLLSENVIQLIANNPEQEEAQEEVVVDYQGAGLEVGFNVSYLQDVLNILKGDEIRLTLSDANSSSLLEDPGDSSSVYVIMPMRL